MQITRFIIMTVALLISTASTAGSIQKWVDASGNVHYGDEPPVGTRAKQIAVDPAPTGSGLRPEEARQLRILESRESSNRSRRSYKDDRDTYYKEVQKRDDELFRCRELDRQFNSGRYRKGEIVAQKRRLGCR